ncbi:MAG TPA: ribbon-helix-helix protein, CopG family [Anaerolineales bacterium]|nr:ribbon-helix-helix protein, CopG family [Anaerolineales bacterium]
MALYTRRVQTVLTEEQYRTLLRLAKRQHRPLSELVRQAIESTYFDQPALEMRRGALQDLLSIRAPVADWGTMEGEIVRGAVEE